MGISPQDMIFEGYGFCAFVRRKYKADTVRNRESDKFDCALLHEKYHSLSSLIL